MGALVRAPSATPLQHTKGHWSRGQHAQGGPRTELVCKHSNHLLVLHGQQRVKEDDALGVEHAIHIGV